MKLLGRCLLCLVLQILFVDHADRSPGGVRGDVGDGRPIALGGDVALPPAGVGAGEAALCVINNLFAFFVLRKDRLKS